jgi:methionyl-tRNA formyltransferase
MKILVLTKKDFHPAVKIVSHLDGLSHKVYVTALPLVNSEKYDLGISVHYQHILKKTDLVKFKYGVINIHPSLLPFGRGSDPIIWGMLEEKPLGVTIHWIDEGIDTGNILYQSKVLPVGLETAEDIYKRVLNSYQFIFPLFWGWFEKTLSNGFVPSGRPQNNDEIKPRRRKDLREIGKVTGEMKNKILALAHSEFNNLYFIENGKRYNINITIGEDNNVKSI